MTTNPDQMFLTESGHPIGELVMSDNSYPTYPSQAEKERANEEELLHAEAMELTNSTDADSAVAELYPSFGDAEKRKRAMILFIVKQMNYRDVAREVEVPERTVSMWIYTYHWDTLAKKELAVQHAQSLVELERVRNAKRVEIAKQQLEQANMIRDRAAESIKKGEVSLKSGAEAWAAAAKIEHTLTGVSESGSVVDVDSKDKEAEKDKGKTPLVMVFQGGLPPIRKV